MTNTKTVNILFCGTGGQGVLKASEVASWAALYDGYHVKKTEVHGMAQRGGSVESHLRFGEIVHSPLIPKGEADFIVPFYKDERDRLIGFLRSGGTDLTKDLERAHKDIKDERYMNTYLLGALSKSLPIKEGSWMKAIETVFAERFVKDNKAVFLQGRGA